MLQTIGGKNAPRPSLSVKRSHIQLSAFRTARPRKNIRPRRSSHFRPPSTARKKLAQLSGELLALPGARGNGHVDGGLMNSSTIPISAGSWVTGFLAQISDSVTTIARDQALMAYMLIGNQFGNSSASGRTAGHWS